MRAAQLLSLLLDLFEHLGELPVTGGGDFLGQLGSGLGQLGGYDSELLGLSLDRFLRAVQLHAFLAGLFQQPFDLFDALRSHRVDLRGALPLDLQRGAILRDLGCLPPEVALRLLVFLMPLLPLPGELRHERAQLVEHLTEKIVELAAACADLVQCVSDAVPADEMFGRLGRHIFFDLPNTVTWIL
ncbi:MAG: hypothetical protein A2V70_16710 [Planctomycetes bacterium RBG_13_63_9]|nr:MAG: hypothetical protein A2V70_16710 [Planctomycetes bacterium RBG_13_63_9]